MRRTRIAMLVMAAMAAVGGRADGKNWITRHVVDPVKHDVVDAGAHKVEEAKDAAGAAASSAFYSTSEATQETVHALNAVDDRTVQPLKQAVELHVVAPVSNVADAAAEMASPAVSSLTRTTDSALRRVGVGPVAEQVQRDTPVFARGVAREVDSAVSLNPTRAVGSALDVGLSAFHTASNAAAAAARPAMSRSPLLMEEPPARLFRPAGSVVSDRPIVFVNGMRSNLGGKDGAEAQAQALAARFHRPVQLVYNQKNNWAVSLGESTYDRAISLIQFGPAKALQADATTRQVTWLLMHADGPVDIVSHSQGGLEVRNALEAADAMGRGDFVRKQVRWVACGAPFVNAEVVTKPKAYVVIVNPHDAIGQLVGGRSTNPAAATGQGHDMLTDYLDAIPAGYFDAP